LLAAVSNRVEVQPSP